MWYSSHWCMLQLLLHAVKLFGACIPSNITTMTNTFTYFVKIVWGLHQMLIQVCSQILWNCLGPAPDVYSNMFTGCVKTLRTGLARHVFVKLVRTACHYHSTTTPLPCHYHATTMPLPWVDTRCFWCVLQCFKYCCKHALWPLPYTTSPTSMHVSHTMGQSWGVWCLRPSNYYTKAHPPTYLHRCTHSKTPRHTRAKKHCIYIHSSTYWFM